MTDSFVKVIVNFGDDDEMVRLRVGEIYQVIDRGLTTRSVPGKAKETFKTIRILYNGSRVSFPEIHFTEPAPRAFFDNPVFGRF